MDENIDTTKEKLNGLIEFKNKITESIRAEKENIHKIPYVDFNNNLKTMLSTTNYVLFGRRGSGKTMLMRNLEENSSEKNICSVYIDCEMSKSYSYPNIIIFILKNIFTQLNDSLKGFGPAFLSKKTRMKKELNQIVIDLEEKLQDSDFKEIEKKNERGKVSTLEGGAQVDVKSVKAGIDKSVKSETKQTEEFKQVNIKIKFLDIKIPEYKRLIGSLLEILKKDRLFIILDDFYFVKTESQHKLADYIHKLCKDISVNFKIATIRHRTKLYERGDSGTIGIQEGMDFTPVDLDYTLDKPLLTEKFMREIIQNLIDKSELKINLNELFIADQNGFRRLVWSSGGVPRDFLTMLGYIIEEIILEKDPLKKINKNKINNGAQKYFSDKMNEFETKEFSDGKALSLFQEIYKKLIEEEKTTSFLIEKETTPNGLFKIFNNLIDLRVIHLVRKRLTKKKKPGKIFDAYILDMGSYSNLLRLGKGIKEIDIFEEYVGRKGDNPFRALSKILDINKI